MWLLITSANRKDIITTVSLTLTEDEFWHCCVCNRQADPRLLQHHIKVKLGSCQCYKILKNNLSRCISSLFFSTPVFKWNVQEFKLILVVIDLFGWLWAEFVNADMKGFNLESQAASSYRHFAVLIRPTCNLTAFSPSSNVKMTDFTYTVSDSWLTFSALQTGPTTKDQQHFNILKLSEMKVGQGSWGFPNYCCCLVQKLNVINVYNSNISGNKDHVRPSHSWSRQKQRFVHFQSELMHFKLLREES